MKTPARFTVALAAGALTLGMGVVTATTAGAASPTPEAKTRDLTTEKARCTAAIDVRLAALARLDKTLGAAKHLTDAHQAAQAASNSAAASGLGSLETKIASDTDTATLAADCKAIYEDHRVFALRAPQTHLIIVGDAETAAVTRLNGLVPKLSDAIEQAATAGKDVSAAQTALTDLKAKLFDAAAKSSGLADSVIGYTPAEYNANHALLDPARADAKAVAADAKAARTDIKTILSTVRASS
jgi:hypothetical protein